MWWRKWLVFLMLVFDYFRFMFGGEVNIMNRW